MIFIGGISQGKKQLEFLQTMICKRCGRLGSISVFVTYTYFSFFFIPIFKWGKQYHAVSSCCQTPFRLSDELGKAIERGEHVTIQPSDLAFEEPSYQYAPTCPDCGFVLDKSYSYCPKCGRKIQ